MMDLLDWGEVRAICDVGNYFWKPFAITRTRRLKKTCVATKLVTWRKDFDVVYFEAAESSHRQSEVTKNSLFFVIIPKGTPKKE